jgi:uncharacterized protein (TIGR02599 family)
MQTCFPGQQPASLAGFLPCPARPFSRATRQERAAFTLVELVVSTAIIALIMLVLVQMTNQTSRIWRSTTEKIEKFEEARDGFEAMTRRLAQATLNTNWDYLDATGKPRPKLLTSAGFNTFVPMMYGRTADLRFLSGPMSSTQVATPITINSGATTYWPTHGVFFQAPLGMADNSADPSFDIMNNLLNTWGYFVQAGYDPSVPGFVGQMQQAYANSTTGAGLVRTRWRSRLMEFRQPSEYMSLYDPAADTVPRWFTTALNGTNPPIHSIAENIIALVIRPKLSKNDEDYYQNVLHYPWQLCPYYIYDSTQTINPGPIAAGSLTGQINPKNQLPPVVQVTMVALDERSAAKLDLKYGTGPSGQGQGQPDMGLQQASQNCPWESVLFNQLFTNQASGSGTPLEGPLGLPSNLQQSDQNDLNYLQQVLIHEGLTYRIFTTNVTIRGAKWSRFQTK